MNSTACDEIEINNLEYIKFLVILFPKLYFCFWSSAYTFLVRSYLQVSQCNVHVQRQRTL